MTESALARRLHKFLRGCDSFYDETPLLVLDPSATTIPPAAGTAAAEAMEPPRPNGGSTGCTNTSTNMPAITTAAASGVVQGGLERRKLDPSIGGLDGDDHGGGGIDAGFTRRDGKDGVGRTSATDQSLESGSQEQQHFVGRGDQPLTAKLTTSMSRPKEADVKTVRVERARLRERTVVREERAKYLRGNVGFREENLRCQPQDQGINNGDDWEQDDNNDEGGGGLASSILTPNFDDAAGSGSADQQRSAADAESASSSTADSTPSSSMSFSLSPAAAGFPSTSSPMPSAAALPATAAPVVPAAVLGLKGNGSAASEWGPLRREEVGRCQHPPSVGEFVSRSRIQTQYTQEVRNSGELGDPNGAATGGFSGRSIGDQWQNDLLAAMGRQEEEIDCAINGKGAFGASDATAGDVPPTSKAEVEERRDERTEGRAMLLLPLSTPEPSPPVLSTQDASTRSIDEGNCNFQDREKSDNGDIGSGVWVAGGDDPGT